MTDTAQFLAFAQQGRFVFDEPGKLSGLLARLNGKRLRITVERHSPQRSLNQNAYFHGVVIPTIAEWSGNSETETKDGLKLRFLRKTIVLPTGEELDTVPSTAKLTSEQFSLFLEQCLAFAAQCGCPVPSREECREGISIDA